MTYYRPSAPTFSRLIVTPRDSVERPRFARPESVRVVSEEERLSTFRLPARRSREGGPPWNSTRTRRKNNGHRFAIPQHLARSASPLACTLSRCRFEASSWIVKQPEGPRATGRRGDADRGPVLPSRGILERTVRCLRASAPRDVPRRFLASEGNSGGWFRRQFPGQRAGPIPRQLG